MKLNDYQHEAASTAIYPKAKGLEYTTLGLVGEAGELANKVKKIIRGDSVDFFALRDELGDVLWYIANTCSVLGVTLSEVAYENIKKIRRRLDDGTIQGEGEDR